MRGWEWHNRLVLSFWTSLWARKNPYSEGEVISIEDVTGFIYDSSNLYPGFFTAFRMTYQVFFCHSERAFGRGRIPPWRAKLWLLKMLPAFICDLSNEYERFFTAFRMTSRCGFVQSVRGILHRVQNDISGWFRSISKQDSSMRSEWHTGVF